jgi:putative restriction endonuclease
MEMAGLLCGVAARRRQVIQSMSGTAEGRMLRLWIANTGLDWFDFLAPQPGIDKVNFWQPSGSNDFGAIRPGELFVFRFKSQRNAIGGYGVFSHASNLPVSLAWEAFGIKNGAASQWEVRERVGKYRRQSDRQEDYTIGCRIVTQPVFLPPERWIPQPPNWAKSIVVGKAYSTDAYARAVSGGKVLPALDAAHIRPYASGGSHEVSNGLLLRRDIHSVFDAGYVTIDEQLRFVVSDRVRTDFNNGNEYRRLHGAVLAEPAQASFRPDREALRWHNEMVFLG